MHGGAASISALWWWPAVDADLAPGIATLSEELGYSVKTTTERVWAVLDLMIKPRFATDPLAVLFPEVSLVDVKPWQTREAFMSALRDSREARLAHVALGHLAAIARGGTLLSPPTRARRTKQAAADWRTVFSRSRLGGNVVFVRPSLPI